MNEAAVRPAGAPSTARHRALRYGFARGLARWRTGDPRGRTQIGNIVAWLQCHPADATGKMAFLAPLIDAFEEWERLSRGLAIGLMRFHEAALRLVALAQDDDDAELARLTQGLAASAGRLRRQPERADEEVARAMAAALLLIAEAATREEGRAPGDRSHFAAAVDARLMRLAQSTDLRP